MGDGRARCQESHPTNDPEIRHRRIRRCRGHSRSASRQGLRQDPQVARGSPEINITKHDAKKGKIEIRKDKQVGGFQISALGDNLTQLVFASSVDVSGSNANSTVVDGILRVCKEVDVKCTVESD